MKIANSPFCPRKCLIGMFVALMGMSSIALGAEDGCQSFTLQGDQFIIDDSSGLLRSGSLAEILSRHQSNRLLSLNFPLSQFCVLTDGTGFEPTSSSEYHVNLLEQELGIKGVIAGSTELWLRVSPSYQSELLLERSVGEAIGLTDMEFLSDNSGVGAEDFFAELIESLALGEFVVDGAFADVPRFGVEYLHYDPTVNQASADFVATQGVLGSAILERLTLTFDPNTKLVVFSQ